MKFLMKSMNFAHIGHGFEFDRSYDNALDDIILMRSAYLANSVWSISHAQNGGSVKVSCVFIALVC